MMLLINIKDEVVDSIANGKPFDIDEVTVAIKNGKPFVIDLDFIQSIMSHRNLTVVTNEYLESLQDRRPQGEWLPNCSSQFMNPGRQCSLCGKTVEFSENFCPNCGAIMRRRNNNG